jgi:hypothetical protein
MVQARDETVRAENETKLTDVIRKELLQRVNPEQTKGLPSFLPLYRGMHLLLSSKDCVQMGIMKGCPVVLRDIVFGDDETLPYDHVAGHPHKLEYMPITLSLEAEKVSWTLPASELPADLPKNIDRRGLFQLRPSYDYLRVAIGADYITVRRTSFLVTPSDTLTVYAAQGGSFDAVVADMQRPPNFDVAKHWLACYVMLSRARSLEAFLILRPATRKELSARPPKYLLDELDRLLRHETTSHQLLVEYIATLGIDVPASIQEVLAPDAAAKELEAVQNIRNHIPTQALDLHGLDDSHSSAPNIQVSVRAEKSAVRDTTIDLQMLSTESVQTALVTHAATLRKRMRSKTSPRDLESKLPKVVKTTPPSQSFRILDKNDIQNCTAAAIVGESIPTTLAHRTEGNDGESEKHDEVDAEPAARVPREPQDAVVPALAELAETTSESLSSADASFTGLSVAAGIVAVGVALSAACATSTNGKQSNDEQHSSVSALFIAEAAEKRARAAEHHGIGDIERAKKLRGAAGQKNPSEELFGERCKSQLRETLERTRAKLALSCSTLAAPAADLPTGHDGLRVQEDAPIPTESLCGIVQET